MKTIVLAGGCFWGVQKFFDQFPGIKSVVGYANGSIPNPTYEQVCRGSGHTEAVEIFYEDPIKAVQILAAYFVIIDPTSLNRQGNDIGINYRTGVYSNDPQILALARLMLKDIEEKIHKKVVVETGSLNHFYEAEDYHQNYLLHNPNGYCHLPASIMRGHSLPTIEQILKAYPSLDKFPEDQLI